MAVCWLRPARRSRELRLRPRRPQLSYGAEAAASRRRSRRRRAHARPEIVDRPHIWRDAGPRRCGLHIKLRRRELRLVPGGWHRDAAFGWRAAFVAAGIGPLLSIAALWLLPSAPPVRNETRGPLLEIGPLLRNRALMAYVIAFAGNTWEVFAVRVWFVACLSWTLSLPGNALPLGRARMIVQTRSRGA
jgi:hypothetical protein